MNKKQVLALVSLFVVTLLGTPCPAQTLQTEMVPVDFETDLATDIWLPSGEMPEEGWPVILRRTPYGRVMQEADVSGFNALGYVYVSQDVRGRGASEGAFLPFLTDAADGKAAIEWAASQPWANGRVCTLGGSAEGVVQLMAAGEAPQGLVGMIPMVATDDVYEGMLPGGVWREELTTAWLNNLIAPDVLAAWRENEADGPYWDRGRLTPEERARIGFPIFMIGGFFDIFAHSQLRMHRDFQEQVSPASRQDQFIMMGPWTHGGLMVADDKPVMEGEVEFIRNASYELFWFDLISFLEWTLKDGDRPAWTAVRYFRTRLSDGGFEASGTWRGADSWPPAGREVSLGLMSDGTILSAPAPAPAGPLWVEVAVDPLNPVPSKGGGNLTTHAGIFDQAVVDERPDVMVFQTPPAAADTVIEGDVVARLTVVFSGNDGDVIVRLSQVTPSGAVMLLSDGAIRGRFVADPAVATPVVPGQAYDVTVRLSPVAIELPAGHALRLSVAGTSAPRFEPNPGYFVPLASQTVEPVAGTLKVLAGESRVLLNVVDGDEWPVVEEPAVSGETGAVEDREVIEDVAAVEQGPDVVPDVVPDAPGPECESDDACDCPDTGCSSSGRSAGPAAVPLVLLTTAVLLLLRRRGFGTGAGTTSSR